MLFVADTDASCRSSQTLSCVFQYETVVDDCTAALELDPRYVKALLRRQQANERLEKYDLAAEGDNSHPAPMQAMTLVCLLKRTVLLSGDSFVLSLPSSFVGSGDCVPWHGESPLLFQLYSCFEYHNSKRIVFCTSLLFQRLYPHHGFAFTTIRWRADAKAVSEIDPSSRSAKDSVARLEKLQHEKNEKMKEEAIGEFVENGFVNCRNYCTFERLRR